MERIAIVGSGPSGLFVAEHILNALPQARVDIIERLPAPYGLVRYGVAPDHQKIKSVTRLFDEIMTNERVRFFGNVTVGLDIDVSELKALYHSIVIATGASAGRVLDIPGRNLGNIFTAAEFVSCYNSHPFHTDLPINNGCDSASIIGHGNVALDVCRVLAKPREGLELTDISTHFLNLIDKFSVRDINLIARGSLSSIKFSLKELREICQIDGWNIKILNLSEKEIENFFEGNLDPAIKKTATYLQQQSSREDIHPRNINFIFNATPCKYLGDGSVGAIECATHGDILTVKSDLVVESVGYRSTPIKGLDFASSSSTLPNVNGRVISSHGDSVENLYTAGWVKRGPSGIVGTNRCCAESTVNLLLEDIRARSYSLISKNIGELLQLKGIDYVDKERWFKIDQAEQKSGEAIGVPRIKFLTVNDMLAV